MEQGKVYVRSPETRRKISEALTGLTRSPETRKRMSEGQRAKHYKRSREWIQAHIDRLSKPVMCEELDRVFGSMTKAAAHVGRSGQAIANCVYGKTKTCAGMHWRLV